jgi:predicted acyltransferase
MYKISEAPEATVSEPSRVPAPGAPQRIRSVDFFRGFTMFLLIGESTLLYRHFRAVEDSSVSQFLATQFSHHQWNGLHFWDLIQPFFMFIVGVAIPFAVANRITKGDSESLITRNAIKRSLLLLFFGWAIVCIRSGDLALRLQNVLAQLSVTYLVAFLLMRKSFSFQLIFTLAILLLVDLAYRFFPVEGFNQPWVAYQNLGAWVNNHIEGVEKSSIWATLNAIPTIAHTMWGVLCGQLLMSKAEPARKMRILLAAGFAGLVIGYSLDLLSITPIIKKIATASFVFVSGGWSILALCFCYWLIDVKKKFTRGSRFFIIVGMNSIFIYVFFEIGGAELISKIVQPLTTGIFSFAGELAVAMATSILAWGMLWYLCYWLYSKKIFFKV